MNHLGHLPLRVIKTCFSNRVRIISVATLGVVLGIVLSIVLGIAHAGPPPQPADPAADQWVQDVDQAYADTRTYQSTGTASIVFQSPDAPKEAPQRATLKTRIAWDRPNRKLFVRMDIDTPAKPQGADGPVILLVSDGQKLRMRSSMLVGHHLETDIPDPFNFNRYQTLSGAWFLRRSPSS